MKMKTLALVAAAGFGLVGAPSVFACSIAAWNGGATGAPVAGRPTDASPTSRYSGQCGLRSNATAAFVTDTTPAAEVTFRARFYVYTGLTAGSALVYQALNAASPAVQQIGVTYDATAGNFTFATNSGSAAVVFLWNTVYHRLPMMRHDMTYFGAGSRADAESDSIYTNTMPGVAKPFTPGNPATNAQYLTIDWTRVSSALTGPKFWPANGLGGVNLAFDTNTEVPDPIGTANEGGNAAWNNGTPEAGVVGVPLHVSLPTTGNITAISVTLTKN